MAIAIPLSKLSNNESNSWCFIYEFYEFKDSLSNCINPTK
jgi:hypothetical protein